MKDLTAQLDAADYQNRQVEKELATRIDWVLTPGHCFGWGEAARHHLN
jgi:hypothetical protein